MFHAIGRFIVKVADLAEAEGRLAVRGVVRAAVIVLLVGASVALGAAATLMLAAAMYLAMIAMMPKPAALAVSAVLVFAVGLATALMARLVYLHRPVPHNPSPMTPEARDERSPAG